MDGTDERTQGKVDELKGRVHEAYGDLTGDQEEQAKGESIENHGKAEQLKGDVKRVVDDLTS